jgi:hypothetical protein
MFPIIVKRKNDLIEEEGDIYYSSVQNLDKTVVVMNI